MEPEIKEEKRMIEAIGLTKRFDDITAVDHIDAQIQMCIRDRFIR